jgi:tetratricopeptide (TPR) repeat protein
VIRGQLAAAAEQLVAVPNEAARLGLLRTPRLNINTFAIWRWLAAYRGHSQALEPSVDERVRADPSARWFGVLFKLQFALQRGALDVAAEHYRELSADDFQPRLRGQPQPANVTTLAEIADACAQIGSPVEAAVFYERLLPHAALVVVDGTMICCGACARVLGRLAMQLGRYAEAEQHFEQALVVNTRLGHQPELVRTQAALAGLLERSGRRTEAEQLSASARARAAAIGMAVSPMNSQSAPRNTPELLHRLAQCSEIVCIVGLGLGARSCAV